MRPGGKGRQGPPGARAVTGVGYGRAEADEGATGMEESRALALLRAERAEVATLLRQTEESARIEEQAPDSPTDFGDAGLPLTEEATDEAIADQLKGRLDAIDRALARLEAGTYGRSVLSGEPIPDQRLEADPAAELTVEEAKASR
jgi:DnaK suppressor protein